jgi:HSP20 family protein
MSALIPFIRRGTLNNWVYDFDRLFDTPTEGFKSFNLQGDLEENEDHIKMSFDFPGLKDGDFSVQVKEDRLTISGERKRSEKPESGGENSYTYYGRQYGKFHKVFVLPPNVNREAIEAEYQDGVLTIILPKAIEEKPKNIEIKVKNKSAQ